MSLYISFLSVSLFLATPSVSFAQYAGGAVDEVERFIRILEGFATILFGLIAIAVACSFLWFFWGLAEYIRNEGGLEEAKKKIFWGLLAIFVLTSLWGIIYFFGVIFLGSNPGTRGTTDIQTFRLPDGRGGATTDPGKEPPGEDPIDGKCNDNLKSGTFPTPFNGCEVGKFDRFQAKSDTSTTWYWHCLGWGGKTAQCSNSMEGYIKGSGDGGIQACGPQQCGKGQACIAYNTCVDCEDLSVQKRSQYSNCDSGVDGTDSPINSDDTPIGDTDSPINSDDTPIDPHEE